MQSWNNKVAQWHDAQEGYTYSITVDSDVNRYGIVTYFSQALRITKQVDEDHTISYEFKLPPTASVETVHNAIIYAIKHNKSLVDALYELGEVELLKLVDSTIKQIKASELDLLEVLKS